MTSKVSVTIFGVAIMSGDSFRFDQIDSWWSIGDHPKIILPDRFGAEINLSAYNILKKHVFPEIFKKVIQFFNHQVENIEKWKTPLEWEFPHFAQPWFLRKRDHYFVILL